MSDVNIETFRKWLEKKESTEIVGFGYDEDCALARFLKEQGLDVDYCTWSGLVRRNSEGTEIVRDDKWMCRFSSMFDEPFMSNVFSADRPWTKIDGIKVPRTAEQTIDILDYVERTIDRTDWNH